MPSAPGWIDVPGKGKRYRMADGSLRFVSPDEVTRDPVGLVNYGLQGFADFLNQVQGRPVLAQEASIRSATTARSVTPPGNYRVPGVGEFDVRSGRPVGAMATAPLVTAPIATPARQAERSERNRMLQQAGGPNISQRLVPTEAEAEAINAAQARAQDAVIAYRGQDRDSTTTSLPAQLDQRDPIYAQRADIQAWMEANKNAPKGADGMNIVDRFLARQRPAAAVDEAPDYAPAGAPTQPWGAADAPGAPKSEGTVVGEKYYGKTWDGSRWVEAGDPLAQTDLRPASQAFPVEPAQALGGELEFAAQATAQESNLNFNSPLPLANQAQAEQSQKTEALLKRFLPAARDLNTPTYGQ